MVENDTAAVGSTGKYVSEHAFGMIDMHLPNIAHCQRNDFFGTMQYQTTTNNSFFINIL